MREYTPVNGGELGAARKAQSGLADAPGRVLVDAAFRVQGLADNETEGVGIRALVNGAWGFAATAVLTPDAVAAIARQAVEQAKANRAALDYCRLKREDVVGTPFAEGTAREIYSTTGQMQNVRFSESDNLIFVTERSGAMWGETSNEKGFRLFELDLEPPGTVLSQRDRPRPFVSLAR